MPRSSRFQSIATFFSFGDSSFSSESRLVVSIAATSEMPVMLPPGCARLWISPVSTGSPRPKAATVGRPTDLAATARGVADDDDGIDGVRFHVLQQAGKLRDVAHRAIGFQRQVLAKDVAALGQRLQQDLSIGSCRG